MIDGARKFELAPASVLCKQNLNGSYLPYPPRMLFVAGGYYAEWTFVVGQRLTICLVRQAYSLGHCVAPFQD
jgi:hypothetical protein